MFLVPVSSHSNSHFIPVSSVLSFSLSLFPSPCGPSFLHHSTPLSSHSISLSSFPFHHHFSPSISSLSSCPYSTLSLFSLHPCLLSLCLLSHFVILSFDLLPHSHSTMSMPYFTLPHPQLLPTSPSAPPHPTQGFGECVSLQVAECSRLFWCCTAHGAQQYDGKTLTRADNFVKLLCHVNICGSPG